MVVFCTGSDPYWTCQIQESTMYGSKMHNTVRNTQLGVLFSSSATGSKHLVYATPTDYSCTQAYNLLKAACLINSTWAINRQTVMNNCLHQQTNSHGKLALVGDKAIIFVFSTMLKVNVQLVQNSRGKNRQVKLKCITLFWFWIGVHWVISVRRWWASCGCQRCRTPISDITSDIFVLKCFGGRSFRNTPV